MTKLNTATEILKDWNRKDILFCRCGEHLNPKTKNERTQWIKIHIRHLTEVVQEHEGDISD